MMRANGFGPSVPLMQPADANPGTGAADIDIETVYPKVPADEVHLIVEDLAALVKQAKGNRWSRQNKSILDLLKGAKTEGELRTAINALAMVQVQVSGKTLQRLVDIYTPPAAPQDPPQPQPQPAPQGQGAPQAPQGGQQTPPPAPTAAVPAQVREIAIKQVKAKLGKPTEAETKAVDAEEKAAQGDAYQKAATTTNAAIKARIEKIMKDSNDGNNAIYLDRLETKADTILDAQPMIEASIKAEQGARGKVKLQLFGGGMDIGGTSGPLGRIKLNPSIEVETSMGSLGRGVLGVDAELDAHRAGYSPGQGAGDTQLFGPGSLGKANPVNYGYYASGYLKLFSGTFTTKAGLNEIFWEWDAPVQGFLSKSKLPGVINYQLGLVGLYDSSPEFDEGDNKDFWRVVGGLAAGAQAGDLDMLNDLAFSVGQDKKWAKQVDAAVMVQIGGALYQNVDEKTDGKKSSVIAGVHVVGTSKDDKFDPEIMLNLSGRLYYKGFHARIDLRPYNNLAEKTGQTENSHWAMAGEAGYTIDPVPVTFKLSAGHYSGTISRAILADSDGFPGIGSPEAATTKTSLTDMGLGVQVKPSKYFEVSAQGFKTWVPAGDGYAGFLQLVLKY